MDAPPGAARGSSRGRRRACPGWLMTQFEIKQSTTLAADRQMLDLAEAEGPWRSPWPTRSGAPLQHLGRHVDADDAALRPTCFRRAVVDAGAASQVEHDLVLLEPGRDERAAAAPRIRPSSSSVPSPSFAEASRVADVSG